MSLAQALILGILQGATEFLPLSSSGHLVLVPWILDWQPAGLVFDAVVHWGTALAVIVYFRRDWVALIGAALRSLRPGTPVEAEARLAWLIALGTIPAALIGYLLEGFFEGMFAQPVPAAGFLLLTATLLVLSERMGRRERDLEALNWSDVVLIGLAQALAILPGISRSGATIAAGLALGLRREQAARFSFHKIPPGKNGRPLFGPFNHLGTDIDPHNIRLLRVQIKGYPCSNPYIQYLLMWFFTEIGKGQLPSGL